MRKLMLLSIGVLVMAACSDAEPLPTTLPTSPAASTTTLAAATTLTPSGSGETTTTVAAGITTDLDLTELWSFGLTSVRTGEPLISEGGLHDLDVNLVSFGHNLVVDASGTVLAPRAAPLQGGEGLVLTDEYQDDHNVRAYAEVFTIMAPIRDTILYRFESTTKEEWLAITKVLTINGIKTQDAAVVDGRSVLSSEQVYDYIASGDAEGSPIARYLEEAGLELKCLAFIGFDFTNPEGANHCEDHGLSVGSGIVFP